MITKTELFMGLNPSPPEPGDFLEMRPTDGTVQKFRFIEVTSCRDPMDMFFATVEDYDGKPKKFRSDEAWGITFLFCVFLMFVSFVMILPSRG
jgi:hypothetical protein